jgi:hypothetical protein
MIQENLSRPPEQWYNEMYLTILVRYVWSNIRGIKTSICIALLLLLSDAACDGSFLFSILVCPIWFIFSILKNVIQRPGWRLALLRIAFPVLTLGLVFANFFVQIRVAEINAALIIAACEDFHTATGKFPKTLDELVPQYMSSIPRAKYCIIHSEFRYRNYNIGHPTLAWYFIPPFGQKFYDFTDRCWHYLY